MFQLKNDKNFSTDMKTLFVTFEGVEGSGKSSQIQNVSDYFTEKGKTVVCTREPGGTEIAEKIRSLLLHQEKEPLCSRAELLLILAARAQHVDQFLQKHRGTTDLILCDRFTDSTLAYQGGARKMKIQQLRDFNTFATNQLQPDVTFLMDLSIADSLNRLAHRTINQKTNIVDRFETEGLDFHEEVRKTYLNLAKEEPSRFVVLNALEKPDMIQKKITVEIEKRMK